MLNFENALICKEEFLKKTNSRNVKQNGDFLFD